MKKFLVLWLWACSVLAAPVSIDLQNVPLKDLIRIVYGEILGQNYVIDGNIQDDLRPVSLVLKAVEPQQAENVLRGLLESQDVIISKSAGVVVLRHGRPEEKAKELFVYKPRYRSVAYLTDLLQTLSSMDRRVAAQAALVRELSKRPRTYPTGEQITALAQDVAAVREMLQQAGKRREWRISLPRPHLPHLSPAWLLIPVILLALWAAWSSWDTLWNGIRTLFP